MKFKCRLCNHSKHFMYLDLGMHPPSDQFLKKDQTNSKITYYPLKITMCEKCKFHQLTYNVAPEELYQKNYPYESSKTKAGFMHFNNFAVSIFKQYKLTEKEKVLDIGSNVGTLLAAFKKKNLTVMGVDPAKNICNLANKNNIKTINSFFDKDFVKFLIKKKFYPKIITATNVFAHIDDLKGFAKNINFLLKKNNGVLIIEAPHFLELYKKLEYDTIYHEHLSYITIKPLKVFFEKNSLEIINVEKKDFHGGSLRIHVAAKNSYKIQNSVKKIIKDEDKNGINIKSNLIKFSRKVEDNRLQITKLLTDLKLKKKRIVALSAPAKGMTLLNYLKLDKTYLEFATEKSKIKQNLLTPGLKLDVKKDVAILNQKIDYALLLAWNFSTEIIKNNFQFLKKGGSFIVPIPKVQIITLKNVKNKIKNFF